MHKIAQFAAALLSALPIAGCAAPAARPVTAPLVQYQRTGGIAGFDDQLVIAADGQATLTRRGATSTFTLDKAALAGLTEALDKAGFAGLQAEYLPTGQGADLFDYVVTYRGHAVHTQDTAVPEALQPVLTALNEVISTHGQ